MYLGRWGRLRRNIKQNRVLRQLHGELLVQALYGANRNAYSIARPSDGFLQDFMEHLLFAKPAFFHLTNLRRFHIRENCLFQRTGCHKCISA